jgi:ribosomal protein L23
MNDTLQKIRVIKTQRVMSASKNDVTEILQRYSFCMNNDTTKDSIRRTLSEYYSKKGIDVNVEVGNDEMKLDVKIVPIHRTTSLNIGLWFE